MAENPRDYWVDVQANVDTAIRNIRLAPTKTSKRLNQIAELRSCGVADHIDLPQLVVCGDQSAGKSSVLEGVSGIPFPRRDGLCTRFPTEIIMRHQPGRYSIVATIIPANDRSAAERHALKRFHQSLSSLEDLPATIAAAATLMGLRGHTTTDEDAPLFASDVLRLEIVGDTGLNLTVVDLPGLISGADDDNDSKAVEDLVATYMQNPRTIILAVVQAGNDIDTEGIIRQAKTFDKTGNRTIGIVTKPDLINAGTEARVAAVTMNKQKLKLGFFLLKNPSPTELQSGVTIQERTKIELSFFAKSPWKEQMLDRSRVGIEKLRAFLEDLLDRHIEQELPQVRKDIKALLVDTQQKLERLGEERKTVGQMRTYLVQLSMDFHNTCNAALNGTYDGPASAFFKSDGTSTGNRLRATLQILNGEYADFMRDHAAKWKIVCDGYGTETDSLGTSSSDMDDKTEDDMEQMKVSNAEMLEWIGSIYRVTRGKELSGDAGQALLSELFRQQSSRWPSICQEHLVTVEGHVTRFIEALLAHVIVDEEVRGNIQEIVHERMERNHQAAVSELEKLMQDEQHHPITYNHYYTDNIQKARRQISDEQVRKSVQKIADDNGKVHVSNTAGEIKSFIAGLQRGIETDMTKMGCNEAHERLKSYYKVARKTLVDNLCRQVIERHIVRNLPQIFDPMSVSSLDDENVEKLAMETPELQKARRELEELRKCLDQGYRALREP